MAYGAFIVGTTLTVFILYYQTDTNAALKLLAQGLLLLGIITFFIQFVILRIVSLIRRLRLGQAKPSGFPNEDSNAKQKEIQAREQIQTDHLQKAKSYKDRILIPREEAKRKQKEEEFRRFLGPAWKGEGNVLGGDNSSDEDIAEGAASGAARRRKLPEKINAKVLEEAIKEKEKRNRKKKVIQLPEEPSEDSSSCILVVLRTPLSEIKQRRFNDSDTIQNVLDYMTTLGFPQQYYTVCTTYPRQSLSDQREVTLKDIGFRGKVTLNIDELTAE